MSKFVCFTNLVGSDKKTAIADHYVNVENIQEFYANCYEGGTNYIFILRHREEKGSAYYFKTEEDCQKAMDLLVAAVCCDN